MSLSFDVEPNSNKNYVYMAIKQYREQKGIVSLLHLLTNSLSYVLSYTNINHIKLSVDKITSVAEYCKNEIILNENLVCDKNNLNLIKIYIAIFHELSHAIVEKRNLSLIYERVCSKEFCPTFSMENIYSIIYKMSKNKNFAYGATKLLYLNDKNEIFARQNSYYLCHVFFREFFPAQIAKIPRFENEIQLSLQQVYINYPIVKGQMNFILELIEKYQLLYIKKFANLYCEEEILQFLSSFGVTFSNKVKQLLVDECVKSESPKYLTTYLCNPMFSPSVSQKAQLEKAFSKTIVKNCIYVPETNKKNKL